MAKSEKRYRWDSPLEWLMDFATRPENREQLPGILEDVASKCDSDTLQDLFQDDMDADGYFDKR